MHEVFLFNGVLNNLITERMENLTLDTQNLGLLIITLFACQVFFQFPCRALSQAQFYNPRNYYQGQAERVAYGAAWFNTTGTKNPRNEEARK